MWAVGQAGNEDGLAAQAVIHHGVELIALLLQLRRTWQIHHGDGFEAVKKGPPHLCPSLQGHAFLGGGDAVMLDRFAGIAVGAISLAEVDLAGEYREGWSGKVALIVCPQVADLTFLLLNHLSRPLVGASSQSQNQDREGSKPHLGLL
jgi:hypothetical protein